MKEIKQEALLVQGRKKSARELCSLYVQRVNYVASTGTLRYALWELQNITLKKSILRLCQEIKKWFIYKRKRNMQMSEFLNHTRGQKTIGLYF